MRQNSIFFFQILFISILFIKTSHSASPIPNLNLATALVPDKTGFTMTGNAASDRFGWVVSKAGDVNGDGYDDIIIGAYYKTSQQGEVYVVYGRPGASLIDFTISSSTLLPASTGFTITGNAAGDYLGYSVGTAGDVDGDGLDDIIIGAYRKNTYKGIAYVIYGKPNASAANIALTTNLDPMTTGFTVTGNAMNDYFAWSVNTAGDVNKDNHSDIIIGAYQKDNNKGAAYVIFGGPRTSMQHLDLANTPLNPSLTGFFITGNANNDNFGYAVGPAGDVNGDGHDDIIVGASGQDSARGAVYIIYGQQAFSQVQIDLSAGQLDPLATGFKITGHATGDQFGAAISPAAGDINKDGYDDIIVGAYAKDAYKGMAYVIYGKPTASIGDIPLDTVTLSPTQTGFSIAGITANDYLGFAVSFAGDMNGDGYDDILIGAYKVSNFKGASYVIYGGEKSSMPTITLATLNPATTGFTITGNADNDRFGYSVCTAGDFNKDGYADIVVGAYGKTSSKGASYLIHAACVTSTAAPCTTRSFCQSCDSTYSASNPKCQGCPANCQQYSGPDSCQTCGSGYFVSSNFKCSQCMQNCQQCTGSSSCGTCNTNYLYYQSQCLQNCPSMKYPSAGTCADCLSNCAVCTSNTDCQTCVEGYWKSGSSQCTQCIPNCQQCSDSSSCTTCDTNYLYYQSQCIQNCPAGKYPSGGTCSDCSSNCASCTSGTNCGGCESGYFLSTAQCSQCISNCQQCADSSSCTTCDATYLYYQSQCIQNCPAGKYPSGGTCLDCLSNCASCTSNTDCQTCVQGYYKSGPSQCSPCIQNCQQCSDSTSCTTCDTNYLYYQSQCIQNCPAGKYPSGGTCSDCLLNCNSCTSGTDCQTCVEGYWKSGSSQCTQCIPNCQQCSDSSSCTTCDTNYLYFQSQCMQNCPPTKYSQGGTCHDCLSNCASCTSNTDCQTCEQGYFKSGTQCTQCIQNCKQCSNFNTCTTCDATYLYYQSQCIQNCPSTKYPSGGTCFDCLSNCASCTSNTDCQTCVQGYYKSGPSQCSPCIQNCQQCSDSSSCDTCDTNYLYYQFQCIQNCPPTKYPSGGTCQDCVLNCNSCTSGTDCQTCVQGYWKSGSSQCTQCIPNCQQCSDSSSCITCAPTYLYYQSQCIQNCPATKYPSGGTCHDCSSNCASCTSNTNCQTCEQGYFKSGTQCTQCMQNCQQCSNSNSCTTCASTYLYYQSQCIQNCPAGKYPSGGTCLDCLSNCASCTSNTDCQTCVQGYYKSGPSQCSPCIQNCQQCSDSTSCTTCDTNYLYYQSQCIQNCPVGKYPSGGTCSDCLLNCNTCTSGTNCQVCEPNYFVLNSQCSPCPQNCKQCSSSTSCEICSLTHFLYQSQCISACPDSTFPSNNICKVCSPRCLSCTSFGSCQLCDSGYTLSNSECILPATKNETASAAPQTIASTFTALGSVICVGSSTFLSTRLISEIVQNMRYVNLVAPQDLTEMYQSWETDLISWELPNALSNINQFKPLPTLFSQYGLEPPFLENFWSNLMTIVIGLGTFFACIVLLRLLKQANSHKWISSVLQSFKAGALNFTIAQTYESLHDTLFYFVLDVKTNPRNSFFSWTCLLSGILFVSIGVFLVFSNLFLVYKYQKLKKEGQAKNDMTDFETFNEKNKSFELFYSDFDDTDALSHSFLAILTMRSGLSAIIVTSIYDNTVIQMILLILMDIAMLFFLIIKRPLLTLRATLAQFFCEIVALFVHACVFMLSMQNDREETPNKFKDTMGTTLRYLNTVLIAGTTGFMLFEILKTIYEKIKAWRAKKKQNISVQPAVSDHSIIHQEISSQTINQTFFIQQHFNININQSSSRLNNQDSSSSEFHLPSRENRKFTGFNLEPSQNFNSSRDIIMDNSFIQQTETRNWTNQQRDQVLETNVTRRRLRIKIKNRLPGVISNEPNMNF